jgi:pimeloyl-ACP methyl ester carboxylesterase
MTPPAGGSLKYVEANGLRFAYLEEGQGPLVLLVHGFPDTAHTWDEVRPALAAAGFRAVSPFTRGYAPTAIPSDGRYDSETLGRDVLALASALGAERAILVGHDWGASAVYAAAALAPDKIRKLVTVAIPHPASLRPSLKLLWGGRHFVRFRLPGAEALMRRDHFAHVDELVRRWSPAWDVPAGETDAVKACFKQPGSLTAALDYYRALGPRPPEALLRKIAVPTVTFSGEHDGVLTLEHYERARRCFTGSYEIVHMPGGHFLHREHPARFIKELLRVLADEPA